VRERERERDTERERERDACRHDFKWDKKEIMV
jgi:hypothetical protein